MQRQLDEELAKAHARCVSFQLLNIELPGQYEDSIVDTQVINSCSNLWGDDINFKGWSAKEENENIWATCRTY